MKIKLFFLLLTTCITASAQYTVTGRVVDKYGNPISGARVEGVGSSRYTFTNMDGTYELETPERVKRIKAESAGMNYNTVKARSGNTIKLKPQTWWNKKPERGQWFAGLQMHIPEYNETSFGIMAGWVKYFGFYVRGVHGFGNKKTVGEWSKYDGNNNALLTGETKTVHSSVGGGGIVRIGSPLYLYFGTGWLWHKYMVECTDDTWREIIWSDNSGIDVDRDNSLYAEFGLMLKYKKLFVNSGLQLSFLEKNGMYSHVGIGMFF